MKKCTHGTYTCHGPQGSINIRVTLVCLNMVPNHELFVYMYVYAFVRHAKVFVDGIECNEDNWS